MMANLLLTLGICGVALLVEWLACAAAPTGYQDSTGFHLGNEPRHDDPWTGNPS